MATGRIGTTPVLTTRWSKAPSAGTTSLSGLDDNSVSLVYSVGYEAVYQNGVLLSRGNDYTATNGTTITLTTATVAGDIIEVFANQTIPLTDTYTQTVANGKFINNTLTTTTGDIIYASAANTPARLGIGSTGQVLKVSGGVPAWGAAPSGMTFITRQTFSGVATADIDDIFSSTYETYQIVIEECFSSVDSALQLQLRYAGPNTQAAAYYGIFTRFSASAISGGSTKSNDGAWAINGDIRTGTGQASNSTIWINQVGNGSRNPIYYGIGLANSQIMPTVTAGYQSTARVYTGIRLSAASGNLSANVSVYGLAKS
jgi:hypothetical protein